VTQTTTAGQSGGSRILRVLAWGLPPLAVLVVLARVLPPDGLEHRAIWQFLGCFHPLSVHFPIALLALALLLEAAGTTARWVRLRAAAADVLVLATVATYVAAALGWLFAWSSGNKGSVVTAHLWAGLWLCLASLLCVALRRPGPAGPGRAYALALVLTVGLMVWTGHLGGRLSHGDNYLSHYVPARIRPLFHLSEAHPPAAAAAAPETGAPLYYEAGVEQLLSRHCVGCHGPDKQKGKLRLDSYEEILQGGKDGAVIEAGRPGDSELYRRVTLPPDDDDFMPSNGKPPLSAAEVALIERWIRTGARRSPEPGR
jgi:uncharacterized membrane protein